MLGKTLVKMNFTVTITTLLVLIFNFTVMSSPVFAATESLRSLYNKNIFYYDPEVGCTTTKTKSTTDSTISGDWIKNIPQEWADVIESAADDAAWTKADPRLVAAVVWIENGGWPDINKKSATSGDGAAGLLQFIDSTWNSAVAQYREKGITLTSRDVPRDSVLAAYLHHKDSKGLPLLKGYTDNPEQSYNAVKIDLNHSDNLLSYIRKYNGDASYPHTDITLKELRQVSLNASESGDTYQNTRYVLMGYWLLATNFAYSWNYTTFREGNFVNAKTGESVGKDLPATSPITNTDTTDTQTTENTGVSNASNCKKSSAVTTKNCFSRALPEITSEPKVVKAINDYIAAANPDSPYKGMGQAFIDGAKTTGVSPFLALAQAQHETSLGTAGWARPQTNLSEPQNVTNPKYKDGKIMTFNAFGRTASSSQPNVKIQGRSQPYDAYVWDSWEDSLTGPDSFYVYIKNHQSFGFEVVDPADWKPYIAVYAPASDGNSEGGYLSALEDIYNNLIEKVGDGISCGTSGGAGGDFIWPIDKKDYQGLTTCWNRLRSINGGPVYGHGGLDISAPRGAKIMAAKDGKVVFTGLVSGHGNLTVLKHDDGLFTFYKHQLRFSVSVGDQVTQGQKIGEVDSTGSSTGDHLHFDIGVTDQVREATGPQATKNPLDYLPADDRGQYGDCIKGPEGTNDRSVQQISI